MKNLDINSIGVWTLRVCLAIGCIILGAIGQDEAASGLGIALIASFFLL